MEFQNLKRFSETQKYQKIEATFITQNLVSKYEMQEFFFKMSIFKFQNSWDMTPFFPPKAMKNLHKSKTSQRWMMLFSQFCIKLY